MNLADLQKMLNATEDVADTLQAVDNATTHLPTPSPTTSTPTQGEK